MHKCRWRIICVVDKELWETHFFHWHIISVNCYITVCPLLYASVLMLLKSNFLSLLVGLGFELEQNYGSLFNLFFCQPKQKQTMWSTLLLFQCKSVKLWLYNGSKSSDDGEWILQKLTRKTNWSIIQLLGNWNNVFLFFIKLIFLLSRTPAWW